MNAPQTKSGPLVRGKPVEELLEEWRAQDAAPRKAQPLAPVEPPGHRAGDVAGSILPSILRKFKVRVR
jgi:hypothetical protein